MKFFNACFLSRLVLLSVIFSAFAAQAQPAPATQPGRYLLVFETSPTMKRAQPAVGKLLASIFMDGLKGSIRDGDEIGVWTVDDRLHSGLFPLTTWAPLQAAQFSGSVQKFLGKQSYSRPGSLAVIMPTLQSIVEHSDRLTIFIFCDGQSPLTGTPFDFGVQRIFNEAAAAQKKAHEPFVLVIRAQQGKFAACAVSLSPNPLNVPDFPPLPPPAPLAPVTVPVTNAPPAIVPATPSLIIVGTNVSTNLDDYRFPEKTNAPAPAVMIKTNAPTAPTNLPPSILNPATNLVSTNAGSATNLVSQNSGPGESSSPLLWLLALAGGVMVIIALMVFARTRRQRGSLITSSMNQPRPPGGRK